MSTDKSKDALKDSNNPVKNHVVPIDAIQEAIKSVKFGVIQLIIQDGRVIQIDKTEKIRFI
jgi:hypothetical protein